MDNVENNVSDNIQDTTETDVSETLVDKKDDTLDIDSIYNKILPKLEEFFTSKTTKEEPKQDVTEELKEEVTDETTKKLSEQIEELNKWKLKAEELEKHNLALKKGLPMGDETQSAKINAVLTLANSYTNDDTNYEQALDKALQIITFTDTKKESGFEVISSPQSGGGKGTRTDDILKNAQKAMGVILK